MSELARSINNTIPLYVYSVYLIGEDWYGYKLDWKPARQAEKENVVVYKFDGREACYWIVSDDNSLSRDDALSFAIRVHSGKCRILHCDLSKVSSNRDKK